MGKTAANVLVEMKKIISEGIYDDAVRWLLWLRRGDPTPADWSAFGRWCACSDAHACAAHEAAWIWHMLGTLADGDPRACSGARAAPAGRRDGARARAEGGDGERPQGRAARVRQK
ncbi:DUF4880 domain-containing protein [Burkholderia alba]|uniref:DUF4880 domain-containing protein n=1 Tax=Burkholderia alba TaxID=2683677 RepID=UPI002B05AF64|nr:DUF4880 domain-containing protein [Burkholderia alba]